MELVQRLRNELKVNTTCGASNLSFGLPNRNGLNTAFIAMAIASGMTSAITNPLHAEIMQIVRGADVVMGHDPECSNWIAVNRDPNADSRERRGRRGGRAAGEVEHSHEITSEKTRWSSSCRPASAVGFHCGRPSWTRREAWASISIRFAAGARSVADARSRSLKANLQSTESLRRRQRVRLLAKQSSVSSARRGCGEAAA